MATRRKQGAKQRIREAAIDLFSAKGFDGTSVREIVKAAGASKPTLYYYFGSKEGLAKELLLEAARELREAFLGEADGGEDLSELVATVIHNHCRYVDRNLKFVGFLFRTVFVSASDAFTETVLAVSQDSREETEAMIRRAACRRGLSRPASQQLAGTVTSVIDAEIMRRIANVKPRMTRRRAKGIARFLVSGAAHTSGEGDCG